MPTREPAAAVQKPRRRKADFTREKLIEAGLTIFNRDHYQNARITDICAEAGKSVGVFYRYFKGKEELLLACADRFNEDLVASAPHSAELDLHLTESLRESVRVYVQKHREYFGVVAGLFEVGMVSPEVAVAWNRLREGGIKRFAARIRRQQAAGKCIAVDPIVSASALMSMLEFSCYNWNARKLEFPRGVTEEVATNALFHVISRSLDI